METLVKHIDEIAVTNIEGINDSVLSKLWEINNNTNEECFVDGVYQ